MAEKVSKSGAVRDNDDSLSWTRHDNVTHRRGHPLLEVYKGGGEGEEEEEESGRGRAGGEYIEMEERGKRRRKKSWTHRKKER